MPNSQVQQNPQVVSTENNFTKGLITEFTGLNFPENAATDTQNCVFTLVGDVTRRDGFDYEENFALHTVNRTNVAVNSYKWNNAGGDATVQIVVEQIGSTLYFYRSSSATAASPLSTQILSSTINLALFVPQFVTFDPTVECQFTDGNGYLFIFHPNCDTIYCIYNNGVITGNRINLQIRDFTGVVDGLGTSVRPSTLSTDHQYNLQNQGWVAGNPWSASSSSSNTVSLGPPKTWFIGTISGVATGQTVVMTGVGADPNGGGFITGTMSGIVVAYAGGNITIQPTSASGTGGIFMSSWTFVPISVGYLNTWFTTQGNYPSNSDVWWYFKDSTGAFNPGTTSASITLSSGNAPRGHYILNAFTQDRSGISGVAGLTKISTLTRPSTGTWFQGRLWSTGVNASFQASGDANFYSWNSNIYFSQIVQSVNDFGNCYQVNDPTSENLFDLLPTDGGVVSIPEAGNIYRLFPLMNAMLIFAANGVWYISGNQGIGFSANDYSIVKLSAVKSISGTSFVDINGLPIFWNEEGIYQVEPAKQGQSLLNTPLHVNPLEVNPLTVGTILTYYNNIPLQSKKFVRGAYNPIDYTVQWVFKSTNETDVTSRYTFDSILNFNVYNKAFYPYTFDIGNLAGPTISGIIYVSSPGGSAAPNSVFKYVVASNLTGTNNWTTTFAEENEPTFTDWTSTLAPANYISYFVTGYKLHGQAQRRFQIPYIYVFSRSLGTISYKIQGIWDYATNRNSNRFSLLQLVSNWNPNFGMIFRRHRIRGRGITLQLKIISTDKEPFDIMGWSIFEMQNVSV